MKVDLSGMINSIKNEVEERETNAAARESSGLKYPLVYPANKGKLTVRILFNVKGNILMRKITRHQGEKFKIPCLSMFEGYDGSCPICDTINEVESLHGKETGVAKKYGRNEKYIAYAKIIDGEASYFDDEKGPHKGDIVILMFPWSVYVAIQGLVLEAEKNGKASAIVSDNEGLPIVIENTGSRPLYNVYVFPYGVQKAYPTDQEFDDMLMGLPDLRETIVSRMLTEKDQTDARTLSDTIKAQYMSNVYVQPSQGVQQVQIQPQPQQVVDPAQVQQQQVNQQAAAQTVQISTTQPVGNGFGTDAIVVDQVQSTVAAVGSKPECFGKHDDNDRKCIMCPMETDCVLAKGE